MDSEPTKPEGADTPSGPTPARGKRPGLPKKAGAEGNGAPAETKPRKTRTVKPKAPPELAEEAARLVTLGFDEVLVMHEAEAIRDEAEDAAAKVYREADLRKRVAAEHLKRAEALAKQATGELVV